MADFMQVRLRKIKNYKERQETNIEDFNRENVEWMTYYFLGENLENRGGSLSSVEKIKIFLRYIADPGFQTGVAEDISVGQSTVSKIIKFVINKIMEKAGDWIKFPVNREEVEKAKQQWQNKFQFPSAIGVIDCAHVRITKPSEHSEEYINRKGYATINVQVTCNANEWFTSVNAQWPGSVHDSQILRNSGDEGYGISSWLMTPFRNPETPQEIRFNLLFTKERIIIERCFGQIKTRFPILQYKVRVKTENEASLIICKIFADDNFDEEYIENADPINFFHAGDEENIRRQGQLRQQQIAEIIYDMAIDN